MKTLKWIGVIIGVAFIISLALPEPSDYYPPGEAPPEQTVQEPVKQTPETVYVDRHDHKLVPKQKVETFYYDPDYPDVLYREDEVHPVQWNYPTGNMHDAFKPGTAAEKSYTEYENYRIRKRYKPTYTLTPVETNQ